jgi:hypothetical protein
LRGSCQGLRLGKIGGSEGGSPQVTRGIKCVFPDVFVTTGTLAPAPTGFQSRCTCRRYNKFNLGQIIVLRLFVKFQLCPFRLFLPCAPSRKLRFSLLINRYLVDVLESIALGILILETENRYSRAQSEGEGHQTWPLWCPPLYCVPKYIPCF